MKKRITSILLCLCMVITLLPATAWAADTHASHPVCGATHSDVGDHTGTCESIVWTAFSADLITDGVLPAGNYYLTEDVTLSSSVKITTDTVNLCLNGHTLNFSSTITVGALNSPATLNICDCGDSGQLAWTGNSSSSSTRNGIDIGNAGTLNLYGGTIRNKGQYGETVNLTSNNQQTGITTFNMYGGKVCHEPTSYSIVYGVVYINADSCAINIYGGEVSTNENASYGAIYADSDDYYTNMTTVLIAGGVIKGGGDGLWLGAQGNSVQLTLAGSPTITCAADDGSGISLGSKEHDPILVRSGFNPTGTISVSHFNDVGVFAESENEGDSLADYAKHFVSAKEGYFVESNADGDLQLTACEIETQPGEGNNYTVSANGSPAYQWYPTTRGTVQVNEDNATACTGVRLTGNGYWSNGISSETNVTQEFFTIDLRQGDELVLTSRSNPGTMINGVSISDGTNSVSVTGEYDFMNGTYTLTAPSDGTYTLSVSASLTDEEEVLSISFAATVTDDVPDEDAPLSGQTSNTLSTGGLASGSYICQVTWEGKTIRYSDAVYVGHTHTLVKKDAKNPTCTETGNIDYWTCEGCGKFFSDADGKTEITLADTVISATGHNYGNATCEAPATCSVCRTTTGNVLGHKDDNTDHTCDRGCGKADMGTHGDTDLDHTCDYGCTVAIGICEDADKNHDCDYGCDKVYGTHEDTDKDHACDYGCSVTIGTCEDSDKDHECDYGCDKEYGTHATAGGKHTCDYCGNAVTTCTDFAEVVKPEALKSAADCTNPAVYYKSCTVCGANGTETFTSGEAKGHSYDEGVVTTKPGCETEGVKTFTCTCGHSYTEPVSATGHTYTKTVTAPTCTEKGYTTYACACGDSYVGDEVAATGHSFTEYKANGGATCTADGTKTAKCDNCEATDTAADTGSKKAHTYEKGKCTVCEAVDPDYVPESSSPQTGDNCNIALWIALLLLSGGAVITLTVYGRKRKTANR